MALKSPAVTFVPGHGQSGDRKVVENYKALLRDLVASVSKHRSAGMSDFEMKEKVVADLSRYRGWSGLDTEIGRMISVAFLQIEQDSF